jgi:lipopolysaccharide export system ATP-binding protein
MTDTMTAHQTSQPATLSARNLRKVYRKRTVVKDVSFDVQAGEVVGLLGPNGAGKTTCFYMVVGLVPADGGNITLAGEEVVHLPIHKRAHMGVSYLPQEASVFRKLTVEENILAVLQLQKLSPEEERNRLETLLDELAIQHIRDSRAASLSGGERRRVEIARALATEPRFILLDEPFAGVDPIAVLEIQKIIRFLKERGIGVLITDHNVRETLGITDRAYIISEGTVLASGRPDDIINNDAVRQVYLGEHFRL